MLSHCLSLSSPSLPRSTSLCVVGHYTDDEDSEEELNSFFKGGAGVALLLLLLLLLLLRARMRACVCLTCSVSAGARHFGLKSTKAEQPSKIWDGFQVPLSLSLSLSLSVSLSVSVSVFVSLSLSVSL